MNAYVGIAEWFEAVMRDSDGLVVPDLEPADVTVTVQLADDASFTLDDLTTTPPATWKERLPGLYGFLYAPLKTGDFTYRVELNSDPAVVYDGLIEVEAALWVSGTTPPPAGLYCSYDDMLGEITKLADAIPAEYAADPEGWVNTRILKAQEAIVDPALLELGYTVPVAAPWGILRGITVNAAAYEIIRPLRVRQDGDHNADWVDTYLVAAQDALKLIPPAVNPDLPPAPAESIFGSVASTTSGREQMPFTLPRATEVQDQTTEVW